jgi:endonuclease YncB( thermonuclease family)
LKREDFLEAALLILLLVGVAFFAFGSKSSRSKYTPPSRATPQKRPAPKRQPFDAQSAHKQPVSTTLQGPAYVVDGDTVVIQKTQIRLFGVDAPEMDHPHGKNAKWALVNLCKGKTIRAEVTEQDAYGRTVAKCYLQDGRDLSAEMVKLGLAIDWPKFSGGKYSSMEVPGVRKKLWLADARQKGRMHVWEQFDARKNAKK